MPDVIVFIGFIVASTFFLIYWVLFLGAFFDNKHACYFDVDSVFISILLSLIYLLIPAWLYKYSQTPWEYDYYTITCFSKDRIDWAILPDNNVINLNEWLKKDFEDGEILKIKRRKNKIYSGILSTNILKYELCNNEIKENKNADFN